MTSKLMKSLLSSTVKLPEEPQEITFLNVTSEGGKIRLDFGDKVLVLEPEGAIQLAKILLCYAKGGGQ